MRQDYTRTICIVLAAVSQIQAFVPIGRPVTTRLGTQYMQPQAAESSSTSLQEYTDEYTPYRQIGVATEGLALGVKPEEFVQYVGTREDIIEMTLRDVPGFNRTKAEEEVDKFLLDAEAVNMMIQYKRMKAEDPDFVIPEEPKKEDSFFSFNTLVSGYIGYVILSTFAGGFRSWAASKAAVGEWSGTGIPFVDEWVANAPVRAVSQAADAVAQEASNVAQTVVDTVVN